MKASHWILGGLLAVGLLFLFYCCVNRELGYEGAIAATGSVLWFGLIVLFPLISVLLLFQLIDR